MSGKINLSGKIQMGDGIIFFGTPPNQSDTFKITFTSDSQFTPVAGLKWAVIVMGRNYIIDAYTAGYPADIVAQDLEYNLPAKLDQNGIAFSVFWNISQDGNSVSITSKYGGRFKSELCNLIQQTNAANYSFTTQIIRGGLYWQGLREFIHHDADVYWAGMDHLTPTTEGIYSSATIEISQETLPIILPATPTNHWILFRGEKNGDQIDFIDSVGFYSLGGTPYLRSVGSNILTTDKYWYAMLKFSANANICNTMIPLAVARDDVSTVNHYNTRWSYYRDIPTAFDGSTLQQMIYIDRFLENGTASPSYHSEVIQFADTIGHNQYINLKAYLDGVEVYNEDIFVGYAPTGITKGELANRLYDGLSMNPAVDDRYIITRSSATGQIFLTDSTTGLKVSALRVVSGVDSYNTPISFTSSVTNWGE